MEIAPGVYKLDCTSGAYAYAVRGEDGVTLVDTSHPGKGKKILDELAGYGFGPGDVRRILLTHCDLDHIGNASMLQAVCGGEGGCTVYIGAADLPYALKQTRMPGLKGLMSAVSSARCPADTQPLPAGKIGGLTVLPAPGHTPGHTCFRFGDVLFLGDLVSSTRNRLTHLPSFYILDKVRVCASVRGMDIDGVRLLCPAHGEPVPAQPGWAQFVQELPPV